MRNAIAYLRLHWKLQKELRAAVKNPAPVTAIVFVVHKSNGVIDHALMNVDSEKRGIANEKVNEESR